MWCETCSSHGLRGTLKNLGGDTCSSRTPAPELHVRLGLLFSPWPIVISSSVIWKLVPYGTESMHGADIMGGAQRVHLVSRFSRFLHSRGNNKRVKVKTRHTPTDPSEWRQRDYFMCSLNEHVSSACCIPGSCSVLREQDTCSSALLLQWKSKTTNTSNQDWEGKQDTWKKKTRCRWWVVRRTWRW